MSNDRAVLESRKEGKSFLELVAKRISEPDLAAELISSAARLVVAAASTNGKENTPVAAAATVVAPSDASLLVKFPGLTLNSPRGKFDIGFSPEALVLSNAKSSVVVPVAAITHVAILDQIPQDTKKRCLMFLVLNRNGPAVMNGKQRLEAVIIQTLETEVLKATTARGDSLDGSAAGVLCEALALVKPGFQEFIAPDAELFRTAKGHLGVSAYVKASAGHLFPLRGGLLFAERPPLFLPLADVMAVEYRRPQSATFDLVLHVRPREGGSGAAASSSVQQVEFSQVDKAELGRLQSYFVTSKVKLFDPAAPPRLDGAAAAGGAGGAAGGAAGSAAAAAGGGYDEEDEDDESDADDEDFDPSELQRLESGRAAKRQRTCASGSGAGPSTSKAAAAEDEDEDEEAEEEEADDDEGGEEGESEDEDEDEDSYDEDEELADLTDEEDMAADVVRRAAKRGQAAGGQHDDDDDDDEDD